jgi:hypothetical protein
LTITLLTALFLEALAVILLRHRLGRSWLRHPVTLVVLASAVYEGLSPALLAIPSIGSWDIARNEILPGYVGDAALLTSAGMLAFTVGYLATLPGRAMLTADPAAVRAAARELGWKWLAVACAPLAAFTFAGRGYNGSVTTGATTPIGTDLAVSFFVITIALASTGFLLAHGTRWFLPVLLLQSVVLAAAGERTPIVTDAITLVLMLSLAGARPRPRQLCGAAVIMLATILAITGLRAQQGRSVFYTDSGLGARLTALGDGLMSLAGPSASGAASPGLLAQFATRSDGTAFTAAILQSEHTGQPRLGAAQAAQSLLLVVPSAVWPSKLSRPALDPYTLEETDFGVPQTNLLPTLPGLYAGYLSPPWLLVFLATAGLLCGRGERWLLRHCTPARLLGVAGTVTAALVYEAGAPAMLVQLRAAAILAATVKVAVLIRGRSRRAVVPRGRDGGLVLEHHSLGVLAQGPTS